MFNVLNLIIEFSPTLADKDPDDVRLNDTYFSIAYSSSSADKCLLLYFSRMNNLRINGRIWLETTAGGTTERFMGIGRLELLQHIQRTGSINQAAKAMKMSYKRAWDLVHSANALADTPVVSTQTGGEKGGGAIVTPEGEKYVAYYRGLQERFQQFLANESTQLPI